MKWDVFFNMPRIFNRLTALVLAAAIIFGTSLGAFAASELGENDARREIINNAPELVPASPKSAELDVFLDELMSEIIDAEADTYSQLKACYDYVKDNTRYGSHVANLDAKIGNTTCRAIDRKYGAVEGFGAVALSAQVGMCNAYASAFILMARKIGFDAYLVKGETKNGYGGYAYHEWCEIKIGDEVYLFDPQLDQSLTRAGLKEYMVFCVTYSQVPGRYRKY